MLSAWQNPGLCTYLQVDHRENGWCNHPPFSKAYSGRGSYIHTHAFGAARASFPYACRGSRPAERPGRREWRGEQVQGGEEGSTAGLVSPGLRKIRRGSGGRVSSSSAVSPVTPRFRRGKPGAFGSAGEEGARRGGR